MQSKRKYSLGFVAFLQALGLILYCSLVALLMWRGNQLFGHVPSYFGPLLFLILFSTSALVCAIITLGYPFILWQQKKTIQAIKLIICTAIWLTCFTLLLLTLIFLLR